MPTDPAQCPVCAARLPTAGDRCAACETRIDSVGPTSPPPIAASQAPTVGLDRVRPSGAALPAPFGQYVLHRIVGAGGMGTVFEAEDTRLGRRVALKTLNSDEAPAEARERFLREAKIAATLDHPNLVPVYDSGEIDGTLFFTMPLVDGLPLDRVLAVLFGRADAAGPDWLPRPTDRAERTALVLGWFEGALAGLHHAHEHGIVHRDIKPPNLLLDATTQQLRIADFGLARAGHLDGATRVGSMMGTVAYMSPEQVRGDTDRIDPRSDVYAMGVTLCKALIDRLPYDAETTADYMNRILTGSPREIVDAAGGLPRDLRTIVLKSLEKSRRDRYQSAQALLDDIRRFRRYEPIAASPPGRLGLLVRWARRKPAAAALLATALVVAPVVAILSAQVVRDRRAGIRAEVERRVDDAMYLLSTGGFRDALRELDWVIDHDDEHLGARLARAFTVARLGAGDDPGRLAAALADLDVVERIRPNAAAVPALRSRLVDDGEAVASDELEPTMPLDYLILGDLARWDGDCERAIELYDEPLRRDPQQALTLLNRGICYAELGRHERAIRDYEVLSRLWPGHHYSHMLLGNALAERREYDEAFAAYERALALAPEFARAHWNYGNARYRAGDFGEAERLIRRSLELESGHTRARNQLGRTLFKLGRPDEAIVEFETVFRAESARTSPNTAVLRSAAVNLCDVNLERRDLGAAAAACVRCAEKYPDYATSQYNLAVLRMLQGDADAALAALERSAELGDNDWKYLMNDGTFEPLRGDRRFGALVERMRIASEAG